VLRHSRRHYKTIAKTLGEEYLKKKELNKTAYVCINDNYGINGYIEGLSELPSPPLSRSSSAKPSVMKMVPKAYALDHQGKRSCKLQSSSDLGLMEPQSMKVKPLTASKKQVSFLQPLEGNEEVSFLDRCPRLTMQPDDTDYIAKLMEKEQF
jgi:hypothetical protein